MSLPFTLTNFFLTTFAALNFPLSPCSSGLDIALRLRPVIAISNFRSIRWDTVITNAAIDTSGAGIRFTLKVFT